MSGQTERAYLLSEEELNILAAVSGMNGLISFQPAQASSPSDRAAAVYQLFQRGALIQGETGVRLADALFPLFRAMREAGSAVLLTPRGSEAPRLLLYCAARELVYLMPHETKQDSLRLGLSGYNDLPERLEEWGLFPAGCTAEPAEIAELQEKDIPPLTLSIGPDDRPSDRGPLDESILTLLERLDVRKGTVQERAAIFRSPIFWGFAAGSRETAYRPFACGDVLNWIKEGSL